MNNMTLSMVLASALMLSSCGIFQKNTTVVTTADSTAQSETVVKPSTNKVAKKSKKQKSKVDTKKAVTTQLAQQAVVISNEVLDGEWTVSRVNGEKVTGDERPYIYFETAQSRFYGSGGCNLINGDYVIDQNKIEFTNMLSTQRMCDNAPFEYQINYGLSQVATYNVSHEGNETYLSLYDKYNVKVLELRKHNMDFINGAWQIIEVGKEKCDDESLRLVIDIPELRIHGNAGCNIVNGQLLIDSDKSYSIQFMQLITTMKSCPDQEREMAILLALEEVEQACPENENVVILADKNGKKLLKLKKIVIE